MTEKDDSVKEESRMSWKTKGIIAGVVVVLLMIGYFFIFGFTESGKLKRKHQLASAVGLDRVIVQLNANGQVIKKWEGRVKVDVTPSGLSFITEDNKEVKISAPYRVEEK